MCVHSREMCGCVWREHGCMYGGEMMYVCRMCVHVCTAGKCVGVCVECVCVHVRGRERKCVCVHVCVGGVEMCECVHVCMVGKWVCVHNVCVCMGTRYLGAG